MHRRLRGIGEARRWRQPKYGRVWAQQTARVAVVPHAQTLKYITLHTHFDRLIAVYHPAQQNTPKNAAHRHCCISTTPAEAVPTPSEGKNPTHTYAPCVVFIISQTPSHASIKNSSTPGVTRNLLRGCDIVQQYRVHHAADEGRRSNLKPRTAAVQAIAYAARLTSRAWPGHTTKVSTHDHNHSAEELQTLHGVVGKGINIPTQCCTMQSTYSSRCMHALNYLASVARLKTPRGQHTYREHQQSETRRSPTAPHRESLAKK